jgi:hypothetical protein
VATDIKLDTENGTWVTIEGFVLKSATADFMLDHPSRRGATATKPYRRALVHDVGDGLTINYAGDYPGGVTINGRVELPGRVTTGKLVILHAAPRIQIAGRTISTPGPPEEIDVAEELLRLRDRISQLEAKLIK